MFIHQIFVSLFLLDDHIVVCAATGSGKTIVFELAIVKLLVSLDQLNCTKDDIKVIYGESKYYR